ncbi:MAG: hypothetical protein OEL56_04205 [Nitrosopumilus sp.]|nr:hypothetical protein [Nitrosopumilus sp.]MDH3515850.1 hypothetical protein [Nitrosopumilus sp.]MDH3564773.1 hypothetical protein [Nitrosopumilus sp.]MDH5418621.1 hypothetical protein [Nitrosopumilus sp.]MDH5555267.1 hypothetical protein [Nitrosopumilus sp.]
MGRKRLIDIIKDIIKKSIFADLSKKSARRIIILKENDAPKNNNLVEATQTKVWQNFFVYLINTTTNKNQKKPNHQKH